MTVSRCAAALAALSVLCVAACGSTAPKPTAAPSTVTTTVTPITPSTSSTPSSSTTPSAPPSSTTPPPPADFSDSYAREHDGVVRITETTCGDTFVASGFLVGPNLIATAAHVVAGEVAVSIADPVSGGTLAGHVIGYDAAHDVALLRTNAPLAGYVFSFAAADPLVGSRIAAIGYPLNGPESLTGGTVSGLNRTITVRGGQTLVGLIQVDVPTNPGNSGGPMIGLDGSVDGIADAGDTDAQGINYAVAASEAAALIDQWRQSPAPVPAAVCQTQVPPPPPATAVDNAVATLIHYVNLVNAQDYVDAFALFSRAGQRRLGSESHWAQSISGSFFANPRVLNISDLVGGGFDVELAFTSTQPGQSCKNWDLDYHMIPAGGGAFLIDIVLPHGGGSGNSPC